MPEENLVWTKINEVSEAGITMVEYADSTGEYCKQVWNDRFVEIFKIDK